MAYFKNWKCNSYRFSHNEKRDYSYQELKEYFFIDGSEVIYCKKDFGWCKAGRYYMVGDGSFYGCGFVVRDWGTTLNGRTLEAGYDSWTDKEYMKGETK